MKNYAIKKVDGNQAALVKFIRSCGASWQHTHTIPGALDGIIGYAGHDQRVEIKDPSQPLSRQELTEMEKTEFDTWKGRRPIIVKTEDDVLAALRRLASL